MVLTFNQYVLENIDTIDYPNAGNNLYYPALGLGGEAGEVLEKIKKIMRDQKGKITEENRIAIRKELGDQLWYIFALCFELNISLESVAYENIYKLKDRKKRGKIGGSGDNR